MDEVSDEEARKKIMAQGRSGTGLAIGLQSNPRFDMTYQTLGRMSAARAAAEAAKKKKQEEDDKEYSKFLKDVYVDNNTYHQSQVDDAKKAIVTALSDFDKIRKSNPDSWMLPASQRFAELKKELNTYRNNSLSIEQYEKDVREGKTIASPSFDKAITSSANWGKSNLPFAQISKFGPVVVDQNGIINYNPMPVNDFESEIRNVVSNKQNWYEAPGSTKVARVGGAPNLYEISGTSYLRGDVVSGIMQRALSDPQFRNYTAQRNVSELQSMFPNGISSANDAQAFKDFIDNKIREDISKRVPTMDQSVRERVISPPGGGGSRKEPKAAFTAVEDVTPGQVAYDYSKGDDAVVAQRIPAGSPIARMVKGMNAGLATTGPMPAAADSNQPVTYEEVLSYRTKLSEMRDKLQQEIDNIADAYNKAPSGNESEQKAKAELLKTKNSKQVFLQNIDANIKFADKTIQDASVKIPVYRSVIYRDNDNTKNPEEQFVYNEDGKKKVVNGRFARYIEGEDGEVYAEIAIIDKGKETGKTRLIPYDLVEKQIRAMSKQTGDVMFDPDYVSGDVMFDPDAEQ